MESEIRPVKLISIQRYTLTLTIFKFLAEYYTRTEERKKERTKNAKQKLGRKQGNQCPNVNRVLFVMN